MHKIIHTAAGDALGQELEVGKLHLLAILGADHRQPLGNGGT